MHPKPPLFAQVGVICSANDAVLRLPTTSSFRVGELAAWTADIQLTSTGAPVVAFEDAFSNVVVIHFLYNAWDLVANFSSPSYYHRNPHLLVDSRGAYFVSYFRGPTLTTGRLVVSMILPASLGGGIRYLGSENGFARAGYYTSMALSPTGRPVVTHQNLDADGSLAVKVWKGTVGGSPSGTWESVGGSSRVSPAGELTAADIAVGSQGQVYAVFSDPEHEKK